MWKLNYFFSFAWQQFLYKILFATVNWTILILKNAENEYGSEGRNLEDRIWRSNPKIESKERFSRSNQKIQSEDPIRRSNQKIESEDQIRRSNPKIESEDRIRRSIQKIESEDQIRRSNYVEERIFFQLWS